MSKENEKRERTKESKEKESNTLSHSARAREELQQIARSIPTVEQVISFAHSIIGFTDDDFIREWHRQMSMAFWCDEFGNPIRNWGWVFNKWRLNKKLFEKLRDPNRIPDARKGGRDGGGSPPAASEMRKVINSPENHLKENGNEKEKIPLHPLKRKSKGKRNKTGML